MMLMMTMKLLQRRSVLARVSFMKLGANAVSFGCFSTNSAHRPLNARSMKHVLCLRDFFLELVLRGDVVLTVMSDVSRVMLFALTCRTSLL